LSKASGGHDLRAPLHGIAGSLGAGAVEHQHLTFFLGEDEFALPIGGIRRVVGRGRTVAVAGAPDWVTGLARLRSASVPVVDLGVKLGRPRAGVSASPCLVFVESPGQTPPLVALVADRVNRVVEIPPHRILPPPSFGRGARVDYLLGVVPEGDRLVLLLDLGKALAEEEWGTLRALTPPPVISN
jgi:purine-binding chemotaxis protein CheW